MTGRPARALGAPEPGAPPALSQALPPGLRPHCLPWDPSPRGPLHVCSGALTPPPLPLPWARGVGRDGWFQGSLRGHPSQSQARPGKPGCLPGLSQPPAQWFLFVPFLVWFCLFFFFFKKNKTFQNKVDNNFLLIGLLTVLHS